MSIDKDQGEKISDIVNKIKTHQIQRQISERGTVETEYFEKD